jgi:ABC-type Fe3+-hydroxamate transport system substrate-binding protein
MCCATAISRRSAKSALRTSFQRSPVQIAGGIDIFADRSNQGAAEDRVVTAEEVIAREPDLIIGS